MKSVVAKVAVFFSLQGPCVSANSRQILEISNSSEEILKIKESKKKNQQVGQGKKIENALCRILSVVLLNRLLVDV